MPADPSVGPFLFAGLGSQNRSVEMRSLIVASIAALCACGRADTDHDAGQAVGTADAGNAVQKFICGPQPYPYNVPSSSSVVVHVDCLGTDNHWYMAMWTFSTVDLFDTGIWSTLGCSDIRVREWTFPTGGTPPAGIGADPPNNCR
jgi:hypothetical protein